MFVGSGGYRDGEQRRDFVFVKDLVRMNMFFGGLLRIVRRDRCMQW